MEELLHGRSVGYPSVERGWVSRDVGDHVWMVHRVHPGEVMGIECVVALLHELE
jgi:hypothetical protein